jgi:hypothetical protein
LAAGGLLWATSGGDGPYVVGPPVDERLQGLDEIDLGAAEGADARFGLTAGRIVPIVVPRSGRGETSLSLIDAEAGTVVDAGPLPVDGWAAEVFLAASDRFVVMTLSDCRSKLVETDTGPDCGDDAPIPIELLVYDLVRERWETVPIGSIPERWVNLDWLDGATATVQLLPTGTQSSSGWAQVDLVDPSAPTSYSPTRPTRPEGLPPLGDEKRWTGDGWSMTNPEASSSGPVWQGSAGGEPRTVTLPPGRPIAAAGRCVLIGTTSDSTLVQLHRLCAS